MTTGKLQENTRKATLTYLLKEGESSAANLASYLDISVQAIRRHLRSLEEEGLVEAVSISLGPGRPSNLWHLTVKGQNLFNSGNGTENFAIELLAAMDSNLSPLSMSNLLTHQALEKAKTYRMHIGSGSLHTRLKKLVDLRNEEGYISEYHRSNDGSSSWYLNAFHCSIRTIAENYPVVCDQELDLIREVFPDCDVQRIQWRLEKGHSCAFQITPSGINV